MTGINDLPDPQPGPEPDEPAPQPGPEPTDPTPEPSGEDDGADGA